MGKRQAHPLTCLCSIQQTLTGATTPNHMLFWQPASFIYAKASTSQPHASLAPSRLQLSKPQAHTPTCFLGYQQASIGQKQPHPTACFFGTQQPSTGAITSNHATNLVSIAAQQPRASTIVSIAAQQPRASTMVSSAAQQSRATTIVSSTTLVLNGHGPATAGASRVVPLKKPNLDSLTGGSRPAAAFPTTLVLSCPGPGEGEEEEEAEEEGEEEE